MGVLLSLFFGFAPVLFFAWIVYWLDRYEKEPLLLLGLVFTWGAVVAAVAAFIVNTTFSLGIYLFTGSEEATSLATGSLVAPVVEESLKGLAVLLVFLFFRAEFDSILDGIIYAAIVALGFAATENAFYIYTAGYQQGGFSGLYWLVFVRVILVGWQHPFYTAFIGIGLAIARMSRTQPIKLIAPLVGFSIAVLAHAAHNTLGSFLTGLSGLATAAIFDWSGWLFMFLFILWAILREQRWIVNHLNEEVSLGHISPFQYRTACSAWMQSSARLNALFSGSFRATNRFYQLCAELAYKKQQRATMGEEEGNEKTIDSLRADLAHLSPQARSR